MIDVERLFYNYIDNHYQAKDGYHCIDIDTMEHPFDEITETLIGYILYKSDNSNAGYIEIWEAGEDFGIVCCEEEMPVANINDFALYLDYMDNGYYITKSDLIQRYCDGILTGGIASDTSFDSWLDYLESEKDIIPLFYGRDI